MPNASGAEATPRLAPGADAQIHTPYDLAFRVERDHTILCTQELTQKDLAKFRKAVERDYYFNVRRGSLYSVSPTACLPPRCMLPRPGNAPGWQRCKPRGSGQWRTVMQTGLMRD